MKLVLVLLLVLIGTAQALNFHLIAALSSHSSENKLKQFCKDDPTGELYSEIWDTDLSDGFAIVGLDPKKYQLIINQHSESSFFTVARLTKSSHPEISTALKIWKLETCITRGYEMLTREDRKTF